ncbi:hypothetical protein Scep_007575 [Stephania cephalantha]|uniref:Uncharacterized protein n=1 Tax=Stephania cephalantha TaxID=152367 RepID=A0AAP0KBY8_9MAGN
MFRISSLNKDPLFLISFSPSLSLLSLQVNAAKNQSLVGVVIAGRPPRSCAVSAGPPSAPADDPAGAAVRELLLREQARWLYRHHSSRESTSIGLNPPSRTLLCGTPSSPP